MSSAWYRAGTVAVTQNSKTVTGSSTLFVTAAVRKGDVFIGPDREIYEIDAVNSNTSITLVSNYLGSSLSGQAYAILRFMGNTVVSLASEIVDKTIKWEQLIDNIDDWLSTPSGNVTLTDSTGGTYTIPSLPQLNSTVSSTQNTTTTHIARTDNPHAVTKTQVGLSNVDNTSDLNKPISAATQNALNLKADMSTQLRQTASIFGLNPLV